MNQIDIFSTEHDTIDIDGIDAIVQFSRYKPDEPDLFFDGLELAEDLMTQSETILYTEGTLISPQRIARLLKLRETNPDIELSFKIKRSEKLIQNFRNEIKEQMIDLFNRGQKSKVFRELLNQIDENIESFIDDVLSEENITLAIYKTRFICESLKTKRSEIYFNHSFNVALFSVAIASSENYADVVGKDKVKLIEIFKVGLFHNYGALTRIENVLKASEDKQFQMYWDENRNGYSTLEKLNFNSEIMNSIRFIYGYYMGIKKFINMNEWPATMANIVLVAEAFLQKVGGLFGASQQVREVVDNLNVQMMEEALNKMAVSVLTSELNFKDIFDFYEELDSLIAECPYGNSGFPYPLTGFKSPTIVICKNEVIKCKYIDVTYKAVNLIKSLGGLEQGSYHRCSLLTLKLNRIYDKHYEEIKDSVVHKEKHNQK